MNSFSRDRLLASTIIAGLAAIAAPAAAQTTGTTDTSSDANVSSAAPIGPSTGAGPAAEEAGAIIVTGSRIQQPNLTSPSPVTVVNAAEIKLQGATRIEDVINSLPQVSPQQGSAVSNGSDGTATLNLRNLGDRRTLVLINGRRLNPGAPSSGAGGTSAADVNAIPQPLIKRIDVLTGGASSVYGSDAVAGVVNFVLDTEYEGFSLDSNYGLFMHDNRSTYFQQRNAARGISAPSGLSTNGRQFDVSMKMGVGTSDGRGHIVAYASYRKIGAIAQSSRDYSNCGFNSNAAGFSCAGSANSFPANFNNLVNGDVYGVDAAGNAVGDGTAFPNIYNANPLNYYQRPDKRYLAGFIGSYEISDAVKPYAEFNFMDDRTVAQIAPSGLFLGSGSVSTLNCNNPLLSASLLGRVCAADNLVGFAPDDPDTAVDESAPAQVFLNPDGTPYTRAGVTIGRRGVEGGGRQADLRHTNYRIVVGTKGDVAPGVSYDVYGQFGSTVFNQIYRNEFSRTRLIRATDVIAGPTGPICRSVADGSDAACVPLDIFNPTGPSAASLAYVQQAGFQNGETKEKVINASFTALGSEYGIQSPFASEGIGLSAGFEYRKEAVRLEVDQAFASGDLTGQGGPTQSISGSFDVKEGFVELQVPIASDRPFFHELTVNGGYRYSSYSTAGSVNSYKGEAVWSPIRDIKFRGGYNRAVRAPNTQELFAAQVLGLGGSDDPCTGATPQFTQAQCANTGVTAAQYGNLTPNPSQQYQDRSGGNPNVKPEKADTFTAGVIIQPTFLRGFSLSVDAFSIKVKDVIQTLGFDTILQQCGLTGNAALCGLVNRDAVGSLWVTENGFINNTVTNAGYYKTRGIDVSTAYTLRTDNVGTIGLSFNGTYTDEFTISRVGANFDCIGYYGGQCGFPQAKWKHTGRLTWNLPMGLGLSGRWRFIGRTKYENTSGDSDLGGSFFPIDRRIKAQNYFDLTASARIADRFSLRVGTNNIFDKRPPILSQTAAPISAFGNGNTYPTVYDANGRYIFAGVTIDM